MKGVNYKSTNRNGIQLQQLLTRADFADVLSGVMPEGLALSPV